MKIVYGKNLTPEQSNLVWEISKNCSISFETARLLFYRNITSVQDAKRFLNAGKEQFYNPFDLSGVKEAVDRITFAKEKNQNVLIYGDYDADGICSTATLYYCLKDFGINARFTVPEREEGYGLNVEKIECLNKIEKIDLIITVDCGVSDGEKIEILKQKGYDVIVTDHHEVPKVLPNCIVINPKAPNQKYPFNGLAGCGVAFKLGSALIREKAYDYLDIVALATFADSMDLVDENRAIVVEGLKIFNENIRPCFKMLLQDTTKTITSQTLVYAIAPRINAGGRMGDAESAMKLLTSSNYEEISILADKLNVYNIERQACCDLVYEKAKEIIASNKLYKKEIILVKHPDWQVGVIGIVAARLVEEFSRPVIVFAEDNGNLKGSCRSVGNFNIYEILEKAKDLYIAFGGHSQAAGLTISKENFLRLEKTLCNLIKEKSDEISYEKEIFVDWEVNSFDNFSFAKEISLLEPFGVGNRKPYFSIVANKLNLVPMKNNSSHYTFNVDEFSLIDFNGDNDVFELQLPLKKTLIFELNYSVFKGREYVKGFLKDYVLDYSNLSSLDEFLFEEEVKKIKTSQNIYSLGDINAIDVSVRQGFGTLYVLNDFRNLTKFELNNVNVYINNIPENNFQNSVLVCPKYIPTGFDRIIYLDNPIFLLETNVKSYVNQENVKNNLFSNINLDREVYIEIFSLIKKYSGINVTSSTELYKYFGENFDFKTFVVAVEVFMELGILYSQNGHIFVDNQKTSQLTNSKIYNTISLYGN